VDKHFINLMIYVSSTYIVAAVPTSVRTMPIGYLITAALAAWCTLMALAPPRRPRPLGVVAFIYGLALNELPFLVFYYLVLSTLLAAAQSNIDSPAGWIGMALSILTVAGLVLVAVRALRAGPVLDRALAEGLGTGGLGTGVLGTGVLGTGRLPLARIVFAPFLMRRRDVERIANISYGDAGVRNRLDVYRQRAHPAGQAGSPVFVHLHGGMLMRGRKNREALPLLYRLASQGWVCISANYRLRPSAHFPDHLIDAKKVIAWVRAHGTEFGADPDVLILAGTSSGGQLAALAAFTQNDPRYQPGFEHADTSVSAVVYLSGYYGSDEQSPWSPLAYDATDAPPFFVVHGDQDTVVPVQDARLFVGRLRKTSPNPVIYAELPGAQHSFERFHSLRFDTLVNAVETFATWVRNSVVDARHS
jgi:acetyl esterase/lipase